MPTKPGVPDAPRVVRADAACLSSLALLDFTFEVSAELTEPFDGDAISPLVPYTKDYGFDVEELAGYLDRQDGDLFVAMVRDARIGYVAVSEGWNGYAVVEDIAVDVAHRGTGAARALMDAAIEWAREAGLSGLRLETQSINVAACRFYRRYGFVLGGHDRFLYRALDPSTREVALYWYYPFFTS
ncbi:GNAT family N-acetyltransferase [Saccharomonospora xinjiangensis]|uniref:Acetyltransferase n=1 Tax=Saccharomonospora xinjiangensis XJ-54 TaxID=882086 RepID=I0V7B4_9PSEU|nr:GNAT family N-acetyltransferase [Saccharomonospora xinjiangensis]EID56017.1 acetyltransferase [Saccharomonospora xinjiangensis XJ-54]